MAGITSLLGTITSSASKSQEKIIEANTKSKKIASSWQGEDQNAFEDAYHDLSKQADNINQRYKRVDSRMSSLQSSIESAERDKAEKRRRLSRERY